MESRFNSVCVCMYMCMCVCVYKERKRGIKRKKQRD